MFPASEVIFQELIGNKFRNEHYNLLQLLARITEMVFNFRDGWSEDMLKTFDSLVKRFVIMLEETTGQWECTITAHNLLHIVEDIVRFGLPDNFWCWYFERAVKTYKHISTNHKNLELSFAKTEMRRELVKFMNFLTSPTPESDVQVKVETNLNYSFLISCVPSNMECSFY